VIPAAASAIGYLAGGQQLRGMLFVEQVNGFDLSPFNELAPSKMGMTLDLFPHEILSGDIELMRFDLRHKTFPITSRRVNVEVTRAGACLGVVQWIKLELDSETRYENRPSPTAAVNGWKHVVYRFVRPRTVVPGDIVSLNVRNHRNQLTVNLVE
jgi:Arginine methyltransferase oligomerization subdomain